MEKFDLFRDVAERTGGEVYIGVVGPVRTGKSTIIRRFMDLVVLPAIDDLNERERARDALPQSGTGRSIMTSEPKFVPDEGVMVHMTDEVSFRIRLVDCVGYAVPGAEGYEEDGAPRLVDSPWFEEKVPFETAAEVGTRKVIQDHATVGLVVTTDGSFGDLDRNVYLSAEERVVTELKELGKPFVVIINSSHPLDEGTQALRNALEATYRVPVLAVNGSLLDETDVTFMMEELLYEFPVRSLEILPPDWIQRLDPTNPLRHQFEEHIEAVSEGIHRIRDVSGAVDSLASFELVQSARIGDLDLGTGKATIFTEAMPGLFERALCDIYGKDVTEPADLMGAWVDLVKAKSSFDQVAEALADVKQFGYGLVPPSMDDMIFEEPELIRQGSRFGVRLRAGAPSVHMIRADIETEVTPIIGTEKQCEDLMQYLLDRFEDDPQLLWQSDIFGKSLSDLAREGIQSKLVHMPENVRGKIQETIQRIVNEGSAGLICIIL